MLRHEIECPHCGNEIIVNDARETQKCRWCRRLISVKFTKGKGRKFKCEVEPLDFPDKLVVQSYNKWEEEDIYGSRH